MIAHRHIYAEHFNVGRDTACSVCGKKPSALWSCKECDRADALTWGVHALPEPGGGAKWTYSTPYCRDCIPSDKVEP